MQTGNVGFVLAGGGSLGAVQVGMLQSLHEAGLRADLIVGASAGAINAAHYSFHPTSAGLRSLQGLWEGIGRGKIFPLPIWHGVLTLLGKSGGAISQHGLRSLLRRVLRDRVLEDAVTPCAIVAADALTGERVVLETGSAVDSLLASTAIPGVFAPIQIDGRLLMDGGIASNTPIRAAIERGVDRLIVLPTGCHPIKPPEGALEVALHALNLLVGRQLERDLREVPEGVSVRVAPPLCPTPVRMFDFSRSRELILKARRQTSWWIRSGGLERSELPAGVLPTCAVDERSEAATVSSAQPMLRVESPESRGR
jgi:NTE family protein